MINVRKLELGILKSNCYLVSDVDTKEAIIIDPGDGAEYIENIISDEEINPKMIIATHGHFDHIMASYTLTCAYKIPFLINTKDEFLVKNMKTSANYFLGINSGPPPKINKGLNEGEIINLSKENLEIIETPGHTPGSVSFYHKQSDTIFVGDLLFENGQVGRSDFSYSNISSLKKSIEKVLRLPVDTKILSGHGGATSVKHEKNFHGLI